MSETGDSPGSEPRRVDAALQRILDRAAAMGEGKPDPKSAGGTATPTAKPKVQNAPNPKPTSSAPAHATAPPGPTRIHPDKRGPLMLANALTEARGGKPVNLDALSYYSPELIQATLPHTDPKVRDWIKKNGDFSLIVSSGVDADAQPYGIPYGAFPRLVLAHIITQVIANQHKKERRIELSSHFGAFLKEIGYTGNHWGNSPSAKRIKDQLDRLLNARITFDYKEGDQFKGRHTVRNLDIAPNFDLWWDYKEPEQGSIFGSYIELSEGFYNAILARPVPLRTEVLKALHKDILALDVYMWVSYRLAGMKAGNKESLQISYAALQAQFGTGIAEQNYRQFRQKLKKSFAKVAQFWIPPKVTGGESLLRHEFTESGIILYSSPMLVSRGRRTFQSDDTAALLESRRFDDETRKQARFLAATLYSVEHLEKQYFAWIESKNLTPGNPRAHFINFVKRHVARNK